MTTETLFWILHLPLMLIFAIGLLRTASRWRGVIRTTRPNLPTALRGLLLDGWLNRRLWRASRLRWLSHSLLLNGMLLLAAMSALSVLSEKLLLPAFPALSGVPLVAMWAGRDHVLKALLNETGSLAMTLGLLIYAVRRYLQRPAQLRSGRPDHAALAALTVILLTGWLTEAVRLIVTYPGQFVPASFLGSTLALQLGKLELPWPALLDAQYLIHGLLVSGILAWLPWSKFMHAPAAALTAMLADGSGLTHVSAPTDDAAGIYTPRQSLELLACTRCGECIPACPTFTEKPALEAITPLRKIETLRQAVYHPRTRQPDLQDHAAGVYDCTLCGRCAEVCPSHIQTRDLWVAMRQDLVGQEQHPPGLNTLRDTLLAQHNLAGDDNQQRMAWAHNLPADQREPRLLTGSDQTDLLYFPGCVSAFYPTAFSIPRAMARLLDASGTGFALLGGEEWCCGYPLYAAGMDQAANELIQHNLTAIQNSGAKQLLTTCPSCYHMWKEQVPRLTGEPLGFEVIHAVDWLDAALSRGALKLKPLQTIATYHDPCDLGRASGIYETPRRLLRAIPGLELREMHHHHELSLCCGGGGDVEMSDEELTAAVARTRIGEAQDTGAQVLLSACQQCKRTLTTAARQQKLRLRVLDIVELLANQLEEEQS